MFLCISLSLRSSPSSFGFKQFFAWHMYILHICLLRCIFELEIEYRIHRELICTQTNRYVICITLLLRRVRNRFESDRIRSTPVFLLAHVLLRVAITHTPYENIGFSPYSNQTCSTHVICTYCLFVQSSQFGRQHIALKQNRKVLNYSILICFCCCSCSVILSICLFIYWFSFRGVCVNLCNQNSIQRVHHARCWCVAHVSLHN